MWPENIFLQPENGIFLKAEKLQSCTFSIPGRNCSLKFTASCCPAKYCDYTSTKYLCRGLQNTKHNQMMHSNNDLFVRSLHHCRMFTCKTNWQPKPGQGWVFSALFPYISNIKRPHSFTNGFETITENFTVKSPWVLHTEIGFLWKTACIQTMFLLQLKT